MNETTLPNLQVLNLASSFFEASELLNDASANAIPIINLRCHAIELFLKSLHLKDSVRFDEFGRKFLVPQSGYQSGHDLVASFGHAQEMHRQHLLAGRRSLMDDLGQLNGVFKSSRYIYENGEGLPLGTAEAVSRYLAAVLPELPRTAVSVDH